MRHRLPGFLPAFLLLTAALATATANANANAADDAAPEPLASLTLGQALDLAERHHPRLAEARAQVEAAAGRAEDAGKLPNPEAIVRAEQVPLRDDATPDRQYVAGFGQAVPLGRRLARARAAERLEGEARRRGLEAELRQLRQHVHRAFATALYQESAFQAQSRIAAGWSATTAATRARLAAGDVAGDELARAEFELARAEMERQRSQALRQQALQSLAAALGQPGREVRSVEGNLEADFEVPVLEELATRLTAHPAWLEAGAAARAARARLDLVRAERIPDVQVEVLYRRLEASRQDTLDFGLRLPLPLVQRQRGRVREAEAGVDAAAARARLTAQELEQGLREAHLALTSALASLQTFRTRLLPRAETILQAAERRLAAGDLALAEVVPVRRDWAAVHLGYLESLRDALQAWAALSAYLGQPAAP